MVEPPAQGIRIHKVERPPQRAAPHPHGIPKSARAPRTRKTANIRLTRASRRRSRWESSNHRDRKDGQRYDRAPPCSISSAPKRVHLLRLRTRHKAAGCFAAALRDAQTRCTSRLTSALKRYAFVRETGNATRPIATGLVGFPHLLSAQDSLSIGPFRMSNAHSFSAQTCGMPPHVRSKIAQNRTDLCDSYRLRLLQTGVRTLCCG